MMELLEHALVLGVGQQVLELRNYWCPTTDSVKNSKTIIIVELVVLTTQHHKPRQEKDHILTKPKIRNLASYHLVTVQK